MAEKAAQRFKVFKWILGILLIICILLFGASWYLSYYLKPIIQKELKALVHTSTSGLYTIDFSSVHTNFITGSATIDDVRIAPDTMVFNVLVKAQKAPDNLYYIQLKQLVIQKFHPFAFLFKKRIEIGQLLFDKPQVSMVNKHFDFNDNRPPRPRKSPYDYISKLFKALQVDVINFRGVNFKYVDNNNLVPQIDSVANLNVTLKNWLIDSLSSQDTTRLYLLKDIDINVNDYSYATPDSMYHLKVKQLDFNAHTGKLRVKQFGLVPRYSEADFTKVIGYAKDRFNIQLNDINMDGIDLPTYIRKRELIANEMNISDGSVHVYNNNTFPKLRNVKTGRFPHQLLQQLNAPLRIKKINLHQIDVSYAAFDKRSGQTGKITFQQTAGTISNVSNVTQQKIKFPVMEANLSSAVMGQGKLLVDFKFYLNSAKGAFDYKGSISQLDGRKLNKIVRPLGMIQISNGWVDRLDFDIKADQDVAKGKLTCRFTDLSVALLKKEDGKTHLVKKGLLSILANALVIYSDNPSKEGKFTKAEINFRRDPKASFFSFIWKALFQGVKYSVGLTPQKEAEIRTQVAKFEQMKDDREERRWRRQLRKENKERSQ